MAIRWERLGPASEGPTPDHYCYSREQLDAMIHDMTYRAFLGGMDAAAEVLARGADVAMLRDVIAAQRAEHDPDTLSAIAARTLRGMTPRTHRPTERM